MAHKAQLAQASAINARRRRAHGKLDGYAGRGYGDYNYDVDRNAGDRNDDIYGGDGKRDGGRAERRHVRGHVALTVVYALRLSAD